MVDFTVFAVQDETGTVAQLTLAPSPEPTFPIEVGDSGVYSGLPDDGTSLTMPPQFTSLPFIVTAVLSNGLQFTISTTNANAADWPADGQITWDVGAANAGDTSIVTGIDGANAYMTIAEMKAYHNSRGNIVPVSATDIMIQGAIVQGTDYLDAKYFYSGVKLLQTIGAGAMDANAAYLQSWLTPYALEGVSYLSPSTTTQSTQWPRQGVVDNNGNTVNGIPKCIKQACAELAIRVLNGTELQPDYDPNLVGAGGVVSSIMEKVGPLETQTTYDTKLGLGFFASFPVVDRLLKSGGVLSSGGGRKLIR